MASKKFQIAPDESDRARLTLADGTVYEGYSFGAKQPAAGEVVFNTGMVGYPEALSDPSYRGQILVLTYPLIGNYGVPSEDVVDAHGLPRYFESAGVHISALVVAHYSSFHSHWTSTRSLGEWLVAHGIPAIHGVDTRALTRRLRESGATLGTIAAMGAPAPPLHDPNTTNLVAQVSTKQTRVFGEGLTPRILAFDCGIKYNIIRYLVEHQKVQLTLVPFDYDLEHNPENIQYDGLFYSNGPGDPTMCQATVAGLRWALQREPPIPVFGVCLGNQIMALAVGAKTYKMRYGNRGMNQPAIDLRTTKCYITSQNHGFAVDMESLPSDWRTFFLNANDHTNEGIIHASRPHSAVQFHPEAAGGPMDTAFLFDTFIAQVRGSPPELTLLSPTLYTTRPDQVRKVLLLGSGGLSIGQAGEFDYSGSQAIKALKEEGLEVVLINPNIATVQTSPASSTGKQTFSGETNLARKCAPDKVYFLPLNAGVVKEVLEREKPDGIIISMGGQTALNVAIELWRDGSLQASGARVLGTPIDTIIATEDREIFSEKLREINETLAISESATTLDEAKAVAKRIGYPVLVRAAFALGGLGSGFAEDESELVPLVEQALSCSPQILIDQDLRGWKEVEYEVVRDCRDNCLTVCNMENFDPLGVHTGDSIVVAPSQTLSNREYFMLRSTALKVVRHLGVVGECNIQYALHPESERYCIIEVNARLSRSSALASKATGYPLAYVAAKLSLGNDLVSIKNSVTKTTTACFEPSLDYCVVKVPRWDLAKFSRVSTSLGSAMKSVGEVMAIGRTFEEAIQKAVRMVHPNLDGLEPDAMGVAAAAQASGSSPTPGADGKRAIASLDDQLAKPTDRRLFAVMAALEAGRTVDQVHAKTKIDRWFLAKLANIASLKQAVREQGPLDKLTVGQVRSLKQAGFSDRQLARYLRSSEAVVRRRRLQLGVAPVVKQIDTLAAEFPAQTNYLYMTYHGTEHDVVGDDAGVLVLGCGAYCIGSSVEFDWSAVSCLRQVRSSGYRSIVLNCNPETVSTDYDESDRLYFEELSLERVLDVYEHEHAGGLIVSVGGQIPNNLATPLAAAGVQILGTAAVDIEQAEDRHQFSAMLDRIGVDQPPWRELQNLTDAAAFADEVGYPVLVRPSFVLSGAAMNVASDASQLEAFLSDAAEVSQDKPVVISKFIRNAKEVEFDAVAQHGTVLNYAISEHVENAGVHSGDATLVLPAQKLYVATIKQVKRIASQIAKSLNITGPFNIQFLARGNEVKVIECNLRASRSFPFVSKTLNCNFITLATRAMLGGPQPVRPYTISLMDIDYVAVKAPMFSFTRLRGADPRLGVEMSSTGEVACFGLDVHDAFMRAMLATGFKPPDRTRNIFVSICDDAPIRQEFLVPMRLLITMGYRVLASPGTAAFYAARDIEKIDVVDSHAAGDAIVAKGGKPAKPAKGGKPAKLPPPPDAPASWASACVDLIRDGQLDLLINIPGEGSRSSSTSVDDSVTDGYLVRRAAVDFGCGLITNIKCATMYVEALHRQHTGVLPTQPLHIDEFYAAQDQLAIPMDESGGTSTRALRGSNDGIVKRRRLESMP